MIVSPQRELWTPRRRSERRICAPPPPPPPAGISSWLLGSDVVAGPPTTNLEVWLRADMGIPSPVNGVKFASWQEQSHNLRTFGQLTVADQLVWNANVAAFNNLPTVTCGSAVCFMNVTGTFTSTTLQPLTIFGVGKTTSTSAQQAMFTGNGSALNWTINLNFPSAGYSTYAGSYIVGGSVTTAVHGICAVQAGVSSVVYVDGSNTVAASGNAGVGGLSTAMAVGGTFNAGGLGWLGDIAEILVYNTGLDLAHRSAVYSYLGTRYNTGWS